MQKLAVALTTQEEFNEYMTFRKKKRRYVYNDSFIKDRIDTGDMPICIDHSYNWSWCPKKWYEDNNHKIISLKEAIWEQEDKEIITFAWPYHPMNWGLVNTVYKNKEIIREGEARGFEPKTGDRILAKTYAWRETIVFLYTLPQNITDKHIGVLDRRYREFMEWEPDCISQRSEIKPIKEPKKEDWIMSLRKELNDIQAERFTYALAIWDDEFRETIEKHMPKLTKSEMLESLKIPQWVEQRDQFDKLRKFLKSKGLLSG